MEVATREIKTEEKEEDEGGRCGHTTKNIII